MSGRAARTARMEVVNCILSDLFWIGDRFRPLSAFFLIAIEALKALFGYFPFARDVSVRLT